MVVIPEIPLSLPTNQKRVHRLHPSPQVFPFKNPSPKAFGEVSLGLLSMSYPFSLLGASNKHFQSPLSGISKLALQNGGGTEPSSLGDASSPLTTHSPSPLSGQFFANLLLLYLTLLVPVTPSGLHSLVTCPTYMN